MGATLPKLDIKLIDAFENDIVWEEIVKRIQTEMDKALNKAVSSMPEPFESGRYRMAEMVLKMPEILKEELNGNTKDSHARLRR